MRKNRNNHTLTASAFRLVAGFLDALARSREPL